MGRLFADFRDTYDPPTSPRKRPLCLFPTRGVWCHGTGPVGWSVGVEEEHQPLLRRLFQPQAQGVASVVEPVDEEHFDGVSRLVREGAELPGPVTPEAVRPVDQVRLLRQVTPLVSLVHSRVCQRRPTTPSCILSLCPCAACPFLLCLTLLSWERLTSDVTHDSSRGLCRPSVPPTFP